MSDANAAESENLETPGQEPAVEAPRSARDDVLAAFKEIDERPATGEKSEVAAPGAQAKPGEKPEAVKGTERGPDGKFLPRDKAAETAQIAAQAAQPQPIAPPPNWKGDGKIDWKRLPRPIQEALAQDYQNRAQLEQRFNPLQEILAPREQTLVGQYGSVATAVRRLFELSDYAARDPQGFVMQFMQQRGISPQQFLPQQQGQPNGAQQAVDQTAIDPRYEALQREVIGLKQVFTQQQQHELQAIQSQANQDVQAFFANADKFPFAQDVRQELIQLFTSGQAKTLEDAYERAILINPTTQKRVMADRVQAELDRQAKVAAEKKLASGSVNGAPGGQPIQAGRRAGRPETVRDSVAAAAAEIGFMGAARL